MLVWKLTGSSTLHLCHKVHHCLLESRYFLHLLPPQNKALPLLPSFTSGWKSGFQMLFLNAAIAFFLSAHPILRHKWFWASSHANFATKQAGLSLSFSILWLVSSVDSGVYKYPSFQPFSFLHCCFWQCCSGQVKIFSTSNQRWFMALVMMKLHLSHSRSLRRLLIKQHSISPSSSATYSATSSPHPMKLKGDDQIAWLWCTMLCYIFCSFPKHLSPLFWGCNKLLKGE